MTEWVFGAFQNAYTDNCLKLFNYCVPKSTFDNRGICLLSSTIE